MLHHCIEWVLELGLAIMIKSVDLGPIVLFVLLGFEVLRQKTFHWKMLEKKMLTHFVCSFALDQLLLLLGLSRWWHWLLLVFTTKYVGKHFYLFLL